MALAGDGLLVTGGGRDLEALKREVQRRADRSMPPVGGIAPDDARTALSGIHSLDREGWARAWAACGERHFAAGEALPSAVA